MRGLPQKTYDIFALYAWLGISIYMAIDPIWHYGAFVNDFRGYYAAAFVLRNGGNPYDYVQTSKLLLEVTGYMGNNPYFYVPWMAWGFIPFTFLPFRMSFLIWNSINLVLWIMGLMQIRSLLNLAWKGWRLYILYFISTLSFAWITFRYGQVGFLLLVFYLSALAAIKREKWVAAGIWMSLCLIKPNVTLIPVTVVCLWLFWRRIYKPLLIVFVVNGTLLVLSFFLMPDWYDPLLVPGAFDGINYDINGPGNLTQDRINPTMPGVMKVLNVDREAASIIYGFSFLAGLSIFLLILRNANSILDVALPSCVLWILITPYAQTYDYVLLVAVYLFLFTLNIRPRVFKFIALVVIALAPLFGTTPLNSYIMVLYLGGLLTIYYWQNRKNLVGSILDSPIAG